MNISYNWLKEYLDFNLTPEETSVALTSIGLEVGSVEEVQTVKGGLEGLVIGFFAGFSNASSVLVGTEVGAGRLDVADGCKPRLN